VVAPDHHQSVETFPLNDFITITINHTYFPRFHVALHPEMKNSSEKTNDDDDGENLLTVNLLTLSS
jgi:hypothetical protein